MGIDSNGFHESAIVVVCINASRRPHVTNFLPLEVRIRLKARELDLFQVKRHDENQEIELLRESGVAFGVTPLGALE
jgi:hypothetical protein